MPGHRFNVITNFCRETSISKMKQDKGKRSKRVLGRPPAAAQLGTPSHASHALQLQNQGLFKSTISSSSSPRADVAHIL